MRVITFLATTSVVLVLSVPSVRADRLSEILAEMKVAGDQLKTLSADFHQTDHDFILGDKEESQGKLYMQVPGRIRWEYAPPKEKILLVKDDVVRLYNPAANQVNEFKQGKSPDGQGGKSSAADLLIGFGKSNEKIAENYDVSLVEETDSSATLSLVPKPTSKASLFTKIELTMSKKTWTPERSVFYEPNKDWTEIQFENVALNRPLPPGIFDLKLPPNVEIIRN